MGWDIRKNDPGDDALMARVYEITRAAMEFERTDAPMWTESENTGEYRDPGPGEVIESYGAFDGDVMVGCGLYAHFVNDNRDKAFVEVWVEPDRRRQGIGSALVDHLVGVAADNGRDVVLSNAVYSFERRDDHPYLQFARSCGFDVSLTQIRRELALPVADDVLQGWIDESAAHHSGYRVEFYAGLPPDAYLESFCKVFNHLIVDAPMGDVDFEPETMTPERLRTRHENDVKVGRTVYQTVAVDEASEEVVAYSTISVVATGRRDMSQWGTMVRSDHRGHRLGLAVKARCLLEVQRLHPERTRISTTNAEVNAHMVAINEQMGYRAMEVEPEFVRRLG